MEDDRLVQLALTRGYVTADQVERARQEQRALADRGLDHSVYSLLQDLGFLTEQQARELRRSSSSSAIRALEVEGFVIQGRLGSGGMGDVFRAVHPDGRQAAVKLLSAKLARTEEYVRRFLREGRAMQRLVHPHIVGVLGSGESLGTRYILMELVEGPSLKSWIVERGKLPPAHALPLLAQMTSALGYAWKHGVLHRDVKPANIILGPPRPGSDEPFCAKLCDFGLARLGPDAGDAELSRGGLTGSGLALGTPHYMSPEQASGEHDIDQRADIYGLGATLYHALLGQTMYSGKSSAVIMYKQVTESADLAQLAAAGIDARLIALIGRMLEKRRSARFADWAGVEAALAALGPAPATPAAPAASSPPSPVHTPAGAIRPAARSEPPPWRALAAVLAGAAVLGLAAAWFLLAGGPAPFGPDALPAALARGSAQELTLLPGTYHGPLRLGAGHRGLVLRAAGPGVLISAPPGSPAIMCEPGMVGARLEGLVLAGDGAPALHAIGGTEVTLQACELRGDLRIEGGVFVLRATRIGGILHASDRAAVEVHGGAIAGGAEIERAEVSLRGVPVSAAMRARGGGLHLEGVRIAAPAGPALAVDRARLHIAEVLVEAPGPTVELREAEVPYAVGFTIRGSGPSLVWSGERQAAWVWQRFACDGGARGLPGGLPPGPGADPGALP
jgi:hypothetical protein